MSHTTRLKGSVIRDIAALRSAVAELAAKGKNIELVENERPRMYYANQHGVSDFVVKLHDGQYDIGIDKQADGTYLPVLDEWSNHISKHLGAACAIPTTAEEKGRHQIGQLWQLYAKHATINTATAQGYMVESITVDEDQTVHMTLMGM